MKKSINIIIALLLTLIHVVLTINLNQNIIANIAGLLGTFVAVGVLTEFALRTSKDKRNFVGLFDLSSPRFMNALNLSLLLSLGVCWLFKC